MTGVASSPEYNVHEVELATITFSDDERQRKELEDTKTSGQTIDELASSIRDLGLLNPIIIERSGRLVAGRRRIEAFRRLGRDRIPARYKDELTERQLKQVEFDENHKRKNLTWQEEAAAVKELHELFLREAAGKPAVDATGVSVRVADRRAVEWSMSDTAKELGLSVAKVSEDLTLAANLDNARVAGRPSRRGALTTAARERELELTRELARRRAGTMGLKTDDTARQFGNGILYNADCRGPLSSLAPDSVDVVFTDPPWGIDFDKSAQWTSKWVATYDDSKDSVRAMLPEAFSLIYKALKPSCHIYCFFPIQEIQWWVEQLTKAGFHVRQRPLVWFKTGQPSITDPYMGFLPVYEAVLWGFKPGAGGVRRLLARATAEGFGLPRQPGIWHENEKPVEFIEPYLDASSVVNEVVLDPFAGSGSTLVAAANAGRYFIGMEQDEINYRKTCERLSGLEKSDEPES